MKKADGKPRQNLSVVFGATLTMLLWAMCFPLISISQTYAPIMLTATLRAIIAGGFLIFFAGLLRRPIPNTTRSYAYLSAIAFFATSVGFWGMFYAGRLISPGLATVLTNTQPLIAGLLGWCILNERVGKQSLVAYAVGFLGIVVISGDSIYSSDPQSLSGITYVVIGATSIAISNVLLKTIASHVDVLYAMGLQLLLGALPLLLLVLLQAPMTIQCCDIKYLWLIVLMAVPGTALPFAIWFWLMEKAPLYQLNVYSFLTPIFGLYFGYMFFSESLSFAQWLGVILVIFAIPLASISPGQKTT